MSIESLVQLESKIQSAIETIGIYRLEVDELRLETDELRDTKEKLEKENSELRSELQAWSERVGSLLGRLDTAQAEDV